MVEDHTGRSPTDPSPEWELPGGGLDFGESFRAAFERELREECGLAVASMGERPLYVWTSKHGPGRGMEWYWILVLVFPFEPVDLNFTPSEECRALRFVTLEEFVTLLPDIAEQIRPLKDRFDPANLR